MGNLLHSRRAQVVAITALALASFTASSWLVARTKGRAADASGAAVAPPARPQVSDVELDRWESLVCGDAPLAERTAASCIDLVPRRDAAPGRLEFDALVRTWRGPLIPPNEPEDLLLVVKVEIFQPDDYDWEGPSLVYYSAPIATPYAGAGIGLVPFSIELPPAADPPYTVQLSLVGVAPTVFVDGTVEENRWTLSTYQLAVR